MRRYALVSIRVDLGPSYTNKPDGKSKPASHSFTDARPWSMSVAYSESLDHDYRTEADDWYRRAP